MLTRTLPYSAYTDDSVLEAERSRLFAKSWQYVGNVTDFTDHHAIPIDVLGLPVILANDDGEVRALVNVCAHRGSIVCREATRQDSLTCPYHAWRYDLAGGLLRAPRSEREPDFDADAHGLETLPVGRWGPFVFVALAGEPAPFEEVLGDLPDLVKAAGVDVDSLVFHHRARSSLEANWKICVENFLECYHCRVAHPAFSKTIDTSPDGYELQSAPTYSTQFGPVRESWTGAFDPTGTISRGQFHLLYPNTAINIMPGEPNISIGPMIPTSPASTDRFLDYFFGPEVPQAWIGPMIEFDDQVGSEDVVLVEDMQRGVAARPERRGTLFMDSENLIAHFEAYVAAAIGG